MSVSSRCFIVLLQEFARRPQDAATHCHFIIRFHYGFVADILLLGY
jgi:hypothetical protein